MLALLVLTIGLLLAFANGANGANDTFKGVATLHGSRVASYRTALAWAVVTTLAGAVTAGWLFTLPVAGILAGGLWFALGFLDA